MHRLCKGTALQSNCNCHANNCRQCAHQRNVWLALLLKHTAAKVVDNVGVAHTPHDVHFCQEHLVILQDTQSLRRRPLVPCLQADAILTGLLLCNLAHT